MECHTEGSSVTSDPHAVSHEGSSVTCLPPPSLSVCLPPIRDVIVKTMIAADQELVSQVRYGRVPSWPWKGCWV